MVRSLGEQLEETRGLSKKIAFLDVWKLGAEDVCLGQAGG